MIEASEGSTRELLSSVLRPHELEVNETRLIEAIRTLEGYDQGSVRTVYPLSTQDRDRLEQRIADAIRARSGRFQLGGVLYKSAGNRISRTLPT